MFHAKAQRGKGAEDAHAKAQRRKGAGKGAFLLLVFGVFLTCSPELREFECEDDNECGAGRICNAGFCEPVTGDSGQGEPDTAAGDAEADGADAEGLADALQDADAQTEDGIRDSRSDAIESDEGGDPHDVDTDEDCVIDDAPWDMIIDSVALDEGKTTDCWGVDECYYGTTVVGPDGSYAPGHVYNCHGRWLIGDFELGINDTPGEPNICPPSPPDPLAVMPGTMPGITYIEFGTPAIPPIPADFFGPGSDPFEGQVALEGVPFQPVTFGNASTLFQRFDFPVMPDDPIGAEGMVEVEIVDLSLRGIDPIIVTYNGGLDPEEWFLTMELAENQVSGTLHATKTHENGETFEAVMPVSPLLTFVREPGTERVLEGLQVDMAWIDPTPFVHQVDPSLDIIAPSNGFFVPGVLEAIPGDPGSQHPLEMPFVELEAGMQSMLFPARHETVSAPVADGQSLPVRSYPNPLQRSTRVEFSLPWPDAVSIRVVDVRGGLVKYLADGRYGAGLASVSWDGTDSRGHDVAPGVYFMVVKTGARSTVSKVTLVK